MNDQERYQRLRDGGYVRVWQPAMGEVPGAWWWVRPVEEEAKMIKRGDRVLTQQGRGTVRYVRMAAPRYNEVAAVSVLLDAKVGRVGYGGTVFPARDVVLVASLYRPAEHL